MRIAFVVETWLPYTDGIITRLTATIAELLRGGHEVLVIGPKGLRPGDTDLPGVIVRTVPTFGIGFIYGGKHWALPAPSVWRYLREFDPDVVHAVNPVVVGTAAVLVARWQRRPLVTSHHTNIASYLAEYKMGWSMPILWAHFGWMHRAADIRLGTSEAAIDELDGHGITGLRLWPRGVDLDRFHPGPTRRRTTTGEPLRALYVGRLSAEKSLTRLLPLAAHAHLTLVGDGPARDQVRRQFPGSTFTGVLRGTALIDAYQDADVFVFPSTTETLGLVLLEALASGLPVVAADSPAIRETLGDCAAARTFPPDRPELLPEIVTELLGSMPSPDLRHVARAYAEQFNWAAATDALLEYYREAIAHGREVAAARTAGPGRRR